MNIKKIVSLSLYSFMFMIQITGCGSITEVMHGTPPLYQNQDKLISTADIIVYGEVVKEYKANKINISVVKSKDAAVNEDNMVLYTNFDVRVDEVIKGDSKTGDIVKVKQLGDKINAQVSEIVDAGGYFKVGGKYILFLASFESILPGTPYETLSPAVGHIEIIDGRIGASNKLFSGNETKENIINILKNKV